MSEAIAGAAARPPAALGEPAAWLFGRGTTGAAAAAAGGASSAALARAVADVASGRGSAEARTLVSAVPEGLGRLLAGRPLSEQAAVTQLALSRPEAMMTPGGQELLVALRSTLAGHTGVPPALEPKRLETITLIDDTFTRLAGGTPEGAVAGLAGHPEYAEVGRIRSNLQLLGLVSRG